MAKNQFFPEDANKGKEKHGLTKFKTLKWTSEEEINEFIDNLKNTLSEEEFDRLKMYIRTLADDEGLNLGSFEIKRIALAMLALDRGDNWFLKKSSDGEWDELKVELQKFLASKEQMIIDTLRKARENSKPKGKSLWDLVDDPTLKNIEVKADGLLDGVDYHFEMKKKKKPTMLKVEVKENGNGNSGSESEQDGREEGKENEKSRKKEE